MTGGRGEGRRGSRDEWRIAGIGMGSKEGEEGGSVSTLKM